MSEIMITCETLRDEINKAIMDTCADIPTLWVESGLHNTPDKLRGRLQELLRSIDGYDTVLMAFGQCGNSVVGLETGNFRLILPRVDDCISLLLGPTNNRTLLSGGGTYFLTPGWLRGERNIWREYQHAVERYGQEMAEQIMSAMLANYETLALLDTGSYDAGEVFLEIREIADALKLKPKLLPASVEYLRDLLTGPWSDDRFLTVAPFSIVGNFSV